MTDADNDRRPDPPVEIPDDIYTRIRTICLSLPEVTVRVDASLTPSRSTAYSFDIRRRSFCLLVARKSSAGASAPFLVLRVDPDERDALASGSHRFFAPRAGRDRLGLWLTDRSDCDEIRELVTDSYRRLAPLKLVKLLD